MSMCPNARITSSWSSFLAFGVRLGYVTKQLACTQLSHPSPSAPFPLRRRSGCKSETLWKLECGLPCMMSRGRFDVITMPQIPVCNAGVNVVCHAQPQRDSLACRDNNDGLCVGARLNLLQDVPRDLGGEGGEGPTSRHVSGVTSGSPPPLFTSSGGGPPRWCRSVCAKCTGTNALSC